MDDKNIQILNDETTIEIFDDSIHEYINSFMAERGINDITEISQSRWYKCMREICRNVIKPNREILRNHKTRYGEYNLDKVNMAFEYYVELCEEAEKIVNQKGFLLFTGIGKETITEWNRNINKITRQCSDVNKRLAEERQESIVALMASSKVVNPTKYLAMLNHYDNWNMPGVKTKEDNTKSIEANEILAALPIIDSETR